MTVCIHMRCVLFYSELIFSDGFFFSPVGVPCALDCRMSLQGRFALVPAGVSKWVTILATFLCKFLAGGSCHILMV